MTFNDNADISGNKVKRRGKTTGIAVGGGAVGVIVIALISQFLGVDVSGLLGGGGVGGGSQEETLLSEECQTGADANANVDCRMGGAYSSLDDYWSEELPALGVDYTSPADFIIFDQQTNTGCGAASSATGPFYCPPDQTIYIDTSFYSELRDRFGASGGPLAEMYVVAHEWGHHIQALTGVMDRADRSGTGPASDSVRIEVQADCFAGAWVAAASDTEDAKGVAFLKPVTQQEIDDALSAAAAVGDDRIQEAATGQVNPEAWTHGSAEQRQRWFMTGYNGGPAACDTFSVSADQL
ncbi:neutral zinc metallopeptidase [Plantibacter sp. VKM Ac-2880]|jgi:predicted metalloprotease|uniref:KPN_02809 family neutral zinc metallopeptidase n=1 Tax=Plantibacter sp. VKM Ac-2880 TaxID=2783827 RepID=UPI00188E8377|nr:neutral zinc metallopeptidase [Plantibacter sp. VKM Ac-2880]MBF4568178.1 neutral zinc metallopeptidase [Plantibacter sp. VKM Ac-2880]